MKNFEIIIELPDGVTEVEKFVLHLNPKLIDELIESCTDSEAIDYLERKKIYYKYYTSASQLNRIMTKMEEDAIGSAYDREFFYIENNVKGGWYRVRRKFFLQSNFGLVAIIGNPDIVERLKKIKKLTNGLLKDIINQDLDRCN